MSDWSKSTRWFLLVGAFAALGSEVSRGLDRLSHVSFGIGGRFLQALAPSFSLDFLSLRSGVPDPLNATASLVLLVLSIHLVVGGRKASRPVLALVSLMWFSGLVGMVWEPIQLASFLVDEVPHLDDHELLDVAFDVLGIVSSVFWFLFAHRALRQATRSDDLQLEVALPAFQEEDRQKTAPWWMRAFHFFLDGWLGLLVVGWCAIRLASVDRFWIRYQDSIWDGTEWWLWIPAAFLSLGLYQVVFEMAWQRTPGKFLTGSHVVREKGYRHRIGFWVGCVRFLLRLFPLAWISSFRARGGFQDSWTGTRVVTRPADVRLALGALGLGGLMVLLPVLVESSSAATKERAKRMSLQKQRLRSGNAEYFLERIGRGFGKGMFLFLDSPEGIPYRDPRPILKVESVDNGQVTLALFEGRSFDRCEELATRYLRDRDQLPRIRIDSAKWVEFVAQGLADPDGPGLDVLGDGGAYQFLKFEEIEPGGVMRATIVPDGKDSLELRLVFGNQPWILRAIEEGKERKIRREIPPLAEFNTFERIGLDREDRVVSVKVGKKSLSLGSSVVVHLEDAIGSSTNELVREDLGERLRIRSEVHSPYDP